MKSFSTQVGGEIQSAGSLLDEGYFGEISFGGQHSIPKTKGQTTTTAVGGDSDSDNQFDMPKTKATEVDCDMDAEEQINTFTVGSQSRNDNRSMYVENPDMFDILEQELSRGKKIVKVRPQQIKQKKEVEVFEADSLEDLPKNKLIKIELPDGKVELIQMEFNTLSKGPTMPEGMIIQQKVEQKIEENRETSKAKPKKEQKPNEWRQDNRTHQDLIRDNQQFVNYYKHLQIIPSDQWKEFYSKLQEPLDIAFRINSIDPNSDRTRSELKEFIKKIDCLKEFKDKQPRPVQWYPHKDTVFAFNEMGRAELRHTPELKEFHKFIVNETEAGRIFRQEKVSMVPVTLLKPKVGDKVLDMCAAPGSKTIQILEYLHENVVDKVNTSGFVIANDSDQKRAYMLTHQARRLNMPCLFVSSIDARKFPAFKIGDELRSFRFDKVLCDVPCSGDGTLRKNVGLWKNYHAHLGHQLHSLQLEILLRGLKLVKQFGRLVYSTCSFNPIENEAVVQAALVKLQGKIKLVDVKNETSPLLKYRPGITRWQVYHKGKGARVPPSWYADYEQVQEHHKSQIQETMFHPVYTNSNNKNDEDKDPLGLKKCMRFYPQDDNQGGFFCAVFEKLSKDDDGLVEDPTLMQELWENEGFKQKPIMDELEEFARWYESELKKLEDEKGIPLEKREKMGLVQQILESKKRIKEQEEASDIPCSSLSKIRLQKLQEKEKDFPYVNLLQDQQSLWNDVKKFYGIDESFPSNCLYRYGGSNTNKIVLLNKGLHEMMSYKKKYKLEVINVGLRLFEKNRQDKSEADYRLLQEGLEVLLPYMSFKRQILFDDGSFLQALAKPFDKMLKFQQIVDQFGQEIADKFQKIPKGSAVIRFPSSQGEMLACSVWIGVNNVSLMLSKEELNSMSFLIS